MTDCNQTTAAQAIREARALLRALARSRQPRKREASCVRMARALVAACQGGPRG